MCLAETQTNLLLTQNTYIRVVPYHSTVTQCNSSNTKEYTYFARLLYPTNQ
uniref:Uncharacterized protein n=1 Tax=Arundo donax TaxID=35708 RepID=A0A0A9AY84_ARUDO